MANSAEVTAAAAPGLSLDAPQPTTAETPIEKATNPIAHQPDGATNIIGTIVFAGFSALSVLVSLVRGIVPIYLAEAALWGGLAWYWHKKNPRSATAIGMVLFLATAVAAGEGFLIGRRSFGNTYTYLSQGNRQYRVDSRLGRTDVLWSDSGWQPVSFNTPPEELPVNERLNVDLRNGAWENGAFDSTGKICFDVKNDSEYVVRLIGITVSLDPPPADDPFSKLGGGYAVDLQKYIGGLLNTGETAKFCGSAPRPFPSGAKWSYSASGAKGWKR